MQSEVSCEEIFVSGIGRKIKNAEKIKRHLARKAGTEEETLTIIRFKPRGGSEDRICVLKLIGESLMTLRKYKNDLRIGKLGFSTEASDEHSNSYFLISSMHIRVLKKSN